MAFFNEFFLTLILLKVPLTT